MIFIVTSSWLVPGPDRRFRIANSTDRRWFHDIKGTSCDGSMHLRHRSSFRRLAHLLENPQWLWTWAAFD